MSLELPPGIGRLHFETGHWRDYFLPGRMSASGRVCEITTDRFVDAKQEWRWFAVRLLWSDLFGGFGSAATVRCQWEQSLAGLRRGVADTPLHPRRRTSSSEVQRTAARGTGQRQVSAPADIRLPNPSDSNQSLCEETSYGKFDVPERVDHLVCRAFDALRSFS